MEVNTKWERGANNMILDRGDYHISCNPNAMGSISEETALYGPDKVWRILNGDFTIVYLDNSSCKLYNKKET